MNKVRKRKQKTGYSFFRNRTTQRGAIAIVTIAISVYY